MEVSDTFQIKIRLGARTFPITIKRDEEIFYRDAEKLINERFTYYANHYPNQGSETYLLMTILDIAVKLQRAEKSGNLKPVMGVLEGLVNEVENALR